MDGARMAKRLSKGDGEVAWVRQSGLDSRFRFYDVDVRSTQVDT